MQLKIPRGAMAPLAPPCGRPCLGRTRRCFIHVMSMCLGVMYFILCKQIIRAGGYTHIIWRKKKPISAKNISWNDAFAGVRYSCAHYTYTRVKQKRQKIRKRSFLDNIKSVYLQGARANGGGGESGNPSISITRTIGRLFECFDGEPFCLRAVMLYAYIYIYIYNTHTHTYIYIL